MPTMDTTITIRAAANSTYSKGGHFSSQDNLVEIDNFVIRINICGENPALRVAAKRV